MKTERNRILKQMRQRVKALRSEEMGKKVEYLNTLKDNAKQFEALKMISEAQRKAAKLIVHDDMGETYAMTKQQQNLFAHTSNLYSRAIGDNRSQLMLMNQSPSINLSPRVKFWKPSKS